MRAPARRGRGAIPLDRCGQAWHGWQLARYGNARDWRLIAPSGETFEPGELLRLRPVLLDLDYLQVRVRQLERQVSGDAYCFTPEECHALVATAQAILRAMPRNITTAKRPGCSGVPAEM